MVAWTGTGRIAPITLVIFTTGLLFCSACGGSSGGGTPDPQDVAEDAHLDSAPDGREDGVDDPQPDADPVPDTEEPRPTPWDGPFLPDALLPPAGSVWHAPDAPEALRIAAEDLRFFLSDMGVASALHISGEAPACAPGHVHVVMVGEGLGSLPIPREGTNDQTWRIRELRCEEGDSVGMVVLLAGRGLLGRQYAAYEWLHQLGVRFFHPEQTYVPERPLWPRDAIERRHTPDFTWRSVSLHLTHPLELGDIFRLGDERYLDEALRYIDWQIRNGASFGTQGVGRGAHAEYGIMRGLPRDSGMSLHNQQQGASAIIDPDDPRSDEEQIAAAIDARFGDDPARYPKFFSFTFNPSEFTEIDDRDVVRQMTFLVNTIRDKSPDTIVMCTNHGTAGPPTPHYGVRYYDLPQFAPPELGVRVHSLMFYDLFRPAPVYGNQSFRFLFDFMVQEYTRRRIWHYPEAAWWLTFDIALPLYLPITLEARHRDIQGIAFMLSGGLDGHRVFGSGHEWGYWQNEYCPFRMTMDISYGWRDCVADIAMTAGDAAPVLAGVIERVVEYQERDLIYGDVLQYVVGSDPETEIAASIGIDFHPLPPSPNEVRQWSLDQVQDWQRRVAPQLKRMDLDYAAEVERLRAVQGLVPERGRPWFDEILDGVEASGLRARHAYEAWGALMTWRQSQITGSSTLATRAEELLARAEATTEEARAVVRRREGGYRYLPLERSIAGGEAGDEDDNWTVYGYRYLNRTHHLYYYTRVNRLITEVMQGPSGGFEIDDALLAPAQPLILRVIDLTWEDVLIDLGDGTETRARQVEHTYDAAGVYALTLEGQQEGALREEQIEVAQLLNRLSSGFSGRILSPAGVDLIEPVIPGLELGALDEDHWVLGFSAHADGRVAPLRWSMLRRNHQAAGLRTHAERILVPVVNRAQGVVQASLQVENGVVSVEGAGEDMAVHIRGDLAMDAVVDAVVSVGGFEPRGARSVVASLLGFTPETLPGTLPFEARFPVQRVQGEGF